MKHAAIPHRISPQAARTPSPSAKWLRAVPIAIAAMLVTSCNAMPNMVTRLNLLADEPGTLEGLSAQLALDARFLYLALSLQRGVRPDLPIRTFRLSINYLMGLFAAFIADHYCNLLL